MPLTKNIASSSHKKQSMKLIAMISDAAEDDTYYFTRTLRRAIGLVSVPAMTMLLP